MEIKLKDSTLVFTKMDILEFSSGELKSYRDPSSLTSIENKGI